MIERFFRSIGCDARAFINIFDFMVDLVFFMEVDGESFRYMHVNESAKRILNTQEGIEGKFLEEVLSEDRAANTNQKYKQAYITRQPVIYSETLETVNGKFIGETMLNPIITKDGQCRYIMAIVREVSERRKLEEILRKSQEKYRLITENATDVIKLINPSGLVEYVSPSYERIFGYKESDYLGQPFMKYIHPDDLTLVNEGFKMIMNGAEVFTLEARMRHNQGHYLWIETTTNPIVEDGKVQQLVTIARDITERVRMRDELAKMAYYDSLTGLPNRRFFIDRLELAIHQADRLKKKVAVMMLDGHKFKQINDTFGHDAGDEVIKEMAKRLQESVRKTDTVVRLGGDEMAVILPELVSSHEAEEVAKWIIGFIDQPISLDDIEINISVGIGIAIYPDHSADDKQLIKFADEALYLAKELQTSSYKVYR